ncbi:hypothetical protein AVEN_178647-1, partial [Araneus ventricosus]
MYTRKIFSGTEFGQWNPPDPKPRPVTEPPQPQFESAGRNFFIVQVRCEVATQ